MALTDWSAARAFTHENSVPGKTLCARCLNLALPIVADLPNPLSRGTVSYPAPRADFAARPHS
jgi:hypothetical protein